MINNINRYNSGYYLLSNFPFPIYLITILFKRFKTILKYKTLTREMQEVLLAEILTIVSLERSCRED